MRADVDPNKKKINYWQPIAIFLGLALVFTVVTPIVSFSSAAGTIIEETRSVTISIYRFNSTDYQMSIPGHSLHIKTEGIRDFKLGDAQCMLLTFTVINSTSLHMSERIVNSSTPKSCN